MRESRAWRRLRRSRDQRRHARPSRHEPLGRGAHTHARGRRWQRWRGSCPKRYWIEINRLLVPFGKHVCTGRAAEVLDLSGARVLPAGRSDDAPLSGAPLEDFRRIRISFARFLRARLARTFAPFFRASDKPDRDRLLSALHLAALAVLAALQRACFLRRIALATLLLADLPYLRLCDRLLETSCDSTISFRSSVCGSTTFCATTSCDCWISWRPWVAPSVPLVTMTFGDPRCPPLGVPFKSRSSEGVRGHHSYQVDGEAPGGAGRSSSSICGALYFA